MIALQADGTADAPNLVVSINTTGRANISISYTLRDIDGTADNAIQPVALQYRIGNAGNFVNVPEWLRRRRNHRSQSRHQSDPGQRDVAQRGG